jgi:predicted branched-subunit amino acid permease
MQAASFYRDPAWRLEFGRGVRDALPAAPGVLAWGIVTGVAMVKSGLSVPWAILISLVVYAGSAQLAALPLIAAAQPVWIVALAGFVTNLRFVIYSATLRRWFDEYSPRRRLVLGYVTGDFTFAMFMNRVARAGEFAHRDAWFLGACGFNWVLWQVASIVGIAAATAIPSEWGLQFAGTLALLALAIPACLQWPGLAGAVVAAPVAVLARGLPFGLGLVAGILAGIAAAVAVDAAVARRKAAVRVERG